MTVARKRQSQTRVARGAVHDDATVATIQILYCELAGEASLIDCVTMHTFEIGMYELPPASPMSLVALNVPQQLKRVLAGWADQGALVEAAFRVDGGTPTVVLQDARTTLELELAGALA